MSLIKLAAKLVHSDPTDPSVGSLPALRVGLQQLFIRRGRHWSLCAHYESARLRPTR